jgi:hypothetical protein
VSEGEREDRLSAVEVVLLAVALGLIAALLLMVLAAI